MSSDNDLILVWLEMYDRLAFEPTPLCASVFGEMKTFIHSMKGMRVFLHDTKPFHYCFILFVFVFSSPQ